MAKDRRIRHRVERQGSPTLRNWDAPRRPHGKPLAKDATVDCGWGRLIFAQTFSDDRVLADVICDEAPRQRNIALYINDPHVVLSLAPQDLFLDPSHTYRLWLFNYRPSRVRPQGFNIRRAQDDKDAAAITRLLSSRNMVPAEPEFVSEHIASKVLTHFIAEDANNGRVIGTVMGVDHKRAFDDVENGSSLWALAVDAQAALPGIGRALVAALADHFQARGREYMDLSVMHDNRAVINLYEKMGFQRVPAFSIKKKNAINEPLYTGSAEGDTRLNPYAQIIVDEARRRGIGVEILDASMGYFSLTLGARTIVCRESLTEMTSAVAMSRCDDKRVTQTLLSRANLNTPPWQAAGKGEDNRAFLVEHERIVVKPARGEQGNGVSVDLRKPEEMDSAIERAKLVCEDVLLEAFAPGDDLRVVLIDDRVVAAAVRRPAEITGNGRDTVKTLIEKKSRRRAAATGGESHIPMDDETLRCVGSHGLGMESVLKQGQTIPVRATANLHTGGTLHDVTDDLHPDLIQASEQAARTLNIPVVGLDFIVEAPDRPEYWIIEANERPGLANHEPQPTAEKLIDYLFPQTAV